MQMMYVNNFHNSLELVKMGDLDFKEPDKIHFEAEHLIFFLSYFLILKYQVEHYETTIGQLCLTYDTEILPGSC